jgi:hypothetical protein
MRKLLCCISLLITPLAAARDVYIIQGAARGVPTTDVFTLWSTDAVFYNTTEVEQVVQLAHISNGGLAGTAPTAFTIPARHTRRLEDATRWRPAQDAPLWVLRLSVPDDVRLESSLYIGSENIFGPPLSQGQRYGKIRLPMFEQIVPAGQRQVHLETHVGDISAHSNVAVYNAAAELASARIDVFRTCDDAPVATRTVNLPPDTMLQVGPFPTRAECGPDASVYTIVTVDQPSLSFVSSLANIGIPITSISIN